MTRRNAVGLLVLALATSAGAGEIELKTGSRMTGELASEVLLVSTGADLIEVAGADVAVLTAQEVTLKDGRTIRGTLVGGRVRMRTEMGELAIDLEQLRAYRETPAVPAAAGLPPGGPTTAAVAPPAGGASAVATVPPAGPAASPGAEPPRPAADPPSPPGQVADGAREIGHGVATAARGVGGTVVEGADRVHDGFKLVGTAIWEGMKSVGHAVRDAFTP